MAAHGVEGLRVSFAPGKAWAALDAWLGRKLTANPRGFSNDVAGAFEILRARLASERHIERRGDPVVESLASRGYADLGLFYDAGLIERIRQGLHAALAQPDLARDRRSPYARQLVNPVGAVPESVELLDARLRELVERYYGGPFRVYRFELRSNFSAPREVTEAQEIYQNYWHVDDRPTSVLKLFVNLSHVSEADGPFELVERAETRRRVRAGIASQRSPALDPPPAPGSLVSLVGRPGHAMLATTARCLHHARLVESGGRRDVAAFSFRPARRPLPEDWARRLDR